MPNDAVYGKMHCPKCGAETIGAGTCWLCSPDGQQWKKDMKKEIKELVKNAKHGSWETVKASENVMVTAFKRAKKDGKHIRPKIEDDYLAEIQEHTDRIRDILEPGELFDVFGVDHAEGHILDALGEIQKALQICDSVRRMQPLLMESRKIIIEEIKEKKKKGCFGNCGDSPESLLERFGVKEKDCEKCIVSEECVADY